MSAALTVPLTCGLSQKRLWTSSDHMVIWYVRISITTRFIALEKYFWIVYNYVLPVSKTGSISLELLAIIFILGMPGALHREFSNCIEISRVRWVVLFIWMSVQVGTFYSSPRGRGWMLSCLAMSRRILIAHTHRGSLWLSFLFNQGNSVFTGQMVFRAKWESFAKNLFRIVY